MVRLLLTHGADRASVDDQGKTPADYARSGETADQEAVIEALTSGERGG